jgi:hypothetical protein
VHCTIQLEDPRREVIALEHYDALMPEYCRFTGTLERRH